MSKNVASVMCEPHLKKRFPFTKCCACSKESMKSGTPMLLLFRCMKCGKGVHYKAECSVSSATGNLSLSLQLFVFLYLCTVESFELLLLRRRCSFCVIFFRTSFATPTVTCENFYFQFRLHLLTLRSC